MTPGPASRYDDATRGGFVWTAREREIVELAARGLSNKVIAERLTVSVRTVEGHLYRAGLKLGVSERTALKDVLGLE